MTPEEARQAVYDRSRVVLRTGPGDVYAEGTVISYSIVPTVTIVTDDGRHIDWRHDMAELAGGEGR